MDNKNLILAIVLSVAIMFGFDYLYGIFYPKPAIPPQQPQQEVESTEQRLVPKAGVAETRAPTAVPTPTASLAPAVPPQGEGALTAPGNTRTQALATAPRVRINTPRLHGSISLIGGRLDDLTLVDYHETIDPDSPEVVLLSPLGAPNAYFADVGWDAAGSAVKVPGFNTRWTTKDTELAPDRPVTLIWDSGEGMLFKRIISVDENYLFTVTQQVENKTGGPATLFPYALLSRHGTPKTAGYYILHEGPLGVFNSTLKELDYKDVKKAGSIREDSTGGWIGITDKYWLVALIPDQEQAIKGRFVYHKQGDQSVYQADFIAGGMELAPGQTISTESRLFAGAKLVRLLDKYSDEYKIPHFDRAIDFGWFYFLTKPIFFFLLYIHQYVGNFGVAILLLTVAIKLLFFPLANKSYRAMSQMRKLQPEIKKLRERFGEDKTRLNQEMMALYKREKVSPASGCLPMVIQIPVFFALYKVLFVTIEMRHAPFFGWIRDLSAPDPTNVFTLFGLIPWDPPTFLSLGALPLLMGISMYLQQKLNPQPPDPMQAKIFAALPVVFTFMLAHFPAGLVLYWTWNNILSILQQWVIMRRAGVIS